MKTILTSILVLALSGCVAREYFSYPGSNVPAYCKIKDGYCTVKYAEYTDINGWKHAAYTNTYIWTPARGWLLHTQEQ